MMNILLIGSLVIVSLFVYLVCLILSITFMSWCASKVFDEEKLSYDTESGLSFLGLIWPVGLVIFFSFLVLFKTLQVSLTTSEFIIRYIKRF